MFTPTGEQLRVRLLSVPSGDDYTRLLHIQGDKPNVEESKYSP